MPSPDKIFKSIGAPIVVKQRRWDIRVDKDVRLPVVGGFMGCACWLGELRVINGTFVASWERNDDFDYLVGGVSNQVPQAMTNNGRE